MAGKQSSEVQTPYCIDQKNNYNKEIIRRKEAEHIREICQYKGIAHASQ